MEMFDRQSADSRLSNSWDGNPGYKSHALNTKKDAFDLLFSHEGSSLNSVNVTKRMTLHNIALKLR